MNFIVHLAINLKNKILYSTIDTLNDSSSKQSFYYNVKHVYVSHLMIAIISSSFSKYLRLNLILKYLNGSSLELAYIFKSVY